MMNSIIRSEPVESMTDQSEIERIVMRRVYTIHILRPFISGFTGGCLLLTVALLGIGREVWVARVFQNTPYSGDIFSVGRFYLAAFDHTRLIVQGLTLLAFASIVYVARECARGLSFLFTSARA